MKIREMVGQLFVFGFSGSKFSPELKRTLRNFHPGGLILFSENYENPEQLSELVAEVNQGRKEFPLFFLADQEGGAVNRLSRPFSHFPGNGVFGLLEPRPLKEASPETPGGKKKAKPRREAEITARSIPDFTEHDRMVRKAVKLAYLQGEVQARELRAVGVGWNLSPVLDLKNAQSKVLEGRCFGKTSEWVSEIGLAFIAGLQDNGVLACGKHFPGHGATAEDSHYCLPRVKLPAETVLRDHLRPFVRTIFNGLKTLMPAHVIYPGLDSSVPATLSPRIIGGMLRKAFGFNGLVITDDLGMNAIKKDFGVGPAACLAFQAGVDILMVAKKPDEQEEAFEAVIKAVERGEIEEERLRVSLQRISRQKKSHQVFLPLDPKERKKILGSKEHKKAVRDLNSLAGGSSAKKQVMGER